MGMFIRAIALATLVAGTASAANAGVVFSDGFNLYGAQANWIPAYWTVQGGTVDLIGETTTGPALDLYPGHGGYVDLDGSNGMVGALGTNMSFGPGTYTLRFDLGGNARGDVAKTTMISLGNWSTYLTLPSSSPYQEYTETFYTTGGNLWFRDTNAGNLTIGNILDNVNLSFDSSDPPPPPPRTSTSGIGTIVPIPEPSTWVMILLGFGALGWAGYRRGLKSRLAPALF